MKLLTLTILATALTGCTHVHVAQTKVDGSKVEFGATSLLSNSTLKNLGVDGTTKTTSNLLKISGAATEPNPEAITASSDAIGNIIGTALSRGVKGVVP